jgi:hypothetical protein
MRISVQGGVADLADDLAKIPPRAAGRMATVVKRNVEQGNRQAQRLARAAAGPHGANYWKRLSGEMTGPLEGEYGPHGDVVGNAVGAGWRNGPPNTDLPKSADIQGPKFANDVAKMLDRLFW